MIYSTDVEKKIITIYEDKRCIMKKRIVMLMTGIMSAAMLLTACEASKGLETDRLKITQYKGVEVEQVEKPKEISDEDVESRIQMMLEGQAETKEITDRAVQGGDTANIDYVGKIGGKEFEGGSAKGYDLEIGSGNFIEGFEDSIIGHKIGETFDWNGKFPDNYGNTEYAGKDVVFTITVNGITERNVPELDDKIVAKLSENAKTVKEYKEEVKKQMEDAAEQEYEDTLAGEVWNKVLENTEVKKASDKEQEKMEELLRKLYESEAKQYGMELEDYVKAQGMTVEDFNEQVVKASAEQNIKAKLVTEAIAEKENISLSDEAYEEHLKKLVESSGEENVEEMKKMLGEEAFEEELRTTALNNLVLDKITETCIQKASGK